ncbi:MULTISPECIES: orotidine-5'-phosphate decarboxylase [Inquilinus]|uniref:Orotidine 5'-phosphate decarboxylase n=1 Tax=Inquilinus ginsengisoli TaxID=363840 RepID=A0ABU1JSB2_9PROT|nr:orotidine-5'-phosphate decarboxylase [Inquilinus ginsengisoli]MDR6291511.1 orotidine-5'-phosphate decarboxylase [Inquilinus ginsengisoli]
MTTNPVFCAIDAPTLDEAKRLIGLVAGAVGGIKLGLEFFMAAGPEGVREARSTGVPLFLDIKVHDIPNTVAGAIRSVVPLSPTYITIHASGGRAMMQAAAEAARSEADKLGVPRPKLLGVTVLTSLDVGDLEAVGQGMEVSAQVERLARLAESSGLDGVICAPTEIVRLRRILKPSSVLMVPGIRPAGSDVGDQKRVMAPKEAMELGATHLVIGRPITGAADPAAAARAIAGELGLALDAEAAAPQTPVP